MLLLFVFWQCQDKETRRVSRGSCNKRSTANKKMCSKQQQKNRAVKWADHRTRDDEHAAEAQRRYPESIYTCGWGLSRQRVRNERNLSSILSPRQTHRLRHSNYNKRRERATSFQSHSEFRRVWIRNCFFSVFSSHTVFYFYFKCDREGKREARREEKNHNREIIKKTKYISSGFDD